MTRTSLIREMGFRANFILGIVRQLLWLAAFVFNIEVIFQHAPTLAGWSKADALIILALSRLLEGLMQTMFISNITEIPTLIQKGTFDLILTKPLPSQWQAAFRKVSIYNSGNILAGLLLFGYIFLIRDATVTASSFAAAFIISLLGMSIYYSILIAAASLGFWLERFQAIWAVNYLISEPLTVPFDIFPRGVRIALTYLLPLAFVVFVPAQALSGRLSAWQLPAALGLAAVFLLLTHIIWRAGLRRYTSASS